MNVGVPKYKVPILAEKKKKMETEIMDRKIPIHPGGSNSFTRFQVAGILDGYLENQNSGR